MVSVLQWLAGGLYLLNKIFLQFSESARSRGKEELRRRWRIAAWLLYMIGLPPWLVIFTWKHNWIAFAVEATGLPAMVLGLTTAITRRPDDPPQWLDRLALWCAAGGLLVSIWDFGGITTINQCLEIALVAGYLIGTRQLALEKMRGYLWFVLMHLAAAGLMWVQDYPLLFWMQIASLYFIARAYRIARTHKAT